MLSTGQTMKLPLGWIVDLTHFITIQLVLQTFLKKKNGIIFARQSGGLRGK